jgi:hypothetical protein
LTPFLRKRVRLLNLFLDERVKATASIYKGGSYHTADGKEIYGFWAKLSDAEFAKLELEVVYRLTLQRQSEKYQCRIGADVALIRPE